MGIEGTYLNIVKAYMICPQQTLVFQWWKTESIPSKIRNEIKLPTLTTISQHILEVLAMASKEEKEIKGIQIRKEVKLSLFADDMLLYVENPKDIIRKLLELISEFSKVIGYKNQHTEIPCIPIH